MNIPWHARPHRITTYANGLRELRRSGVLSADVAFSEWDGYTGHIRGDMIEIRWRDPAHKNRKNGSIIYAAPWAYVAAVSA